MIATAWKRARQAIADPGDIEEDNQLIVIVHPKPKRAVGLAEGDRPARRIAASSHHDRVPRGIHQIHHASDDRLEGG